MSLYQRLVWAIGGLLMLLLAASLLVAVFQSRDQLGRQMAAHATDAATSLGLSLSHTAGNNDPARIRSFINVVFDRGYYRLVQYRSLNGGVQIESRLPEVIEGVPAWFVDLLHLPPAQASAEVMDGWLRLGQVRVESHPGYVYRDLWRIFVRQCWIFVAAALASCLLAALALRRLLRPLQHLQGQAEAICRREFRHQETLPKVPELRRVVEAMNRMVARLQGIFREQVALSERLQREACRDPLTDLPNRADFSARLQALAAAEQGAAGAVLVLLHVEGLAGLNLDRGRERGDACLQAVAAQVRGWLSAQPHCFGGRLGGADFGLLLPAVGRGEAADRLAPLLAGLAALHWWDGDSGLRLCSGAAEAPLEGGQDLLARADLALRQAQRKRGRELHWLEPTGQVEVRGAGAWEHLLRQALDCRGLGFFLQPVYRSDGELLQYEVLCRLREGEHWLPAAQLLPAAERCGLAPALDRQMLEQLATAALPDQVPLVMNLSPRSVTDPAFVDWLAEFLVSVPRLSRRLLLELPEWFAAQQPAPWRNLARRIETSGAGLSLDQFGSHASVLPHIHSLPLYSLRLERSFVAAIERRPEHRFLVSSLLQIAHSCEALLIAEGVESEAEWCSLQALGIDAGQGYWLGPPAPLQDLARRGRDPGSEA